MARPSKGDRAYHMVKFHPAVLQRLVDKATDAGVSSVSQYGADVLAAHVGMPEHVRELNQTPISAARKIDPLHGDTRGRCMIRPHREVSERLIRQAPDHKVSPYIADILAVHVGLHEYASLIDHEEVLPLAM